jgi:hypothetical protein
MLAMKWGNLDGNTYNVTENLRRDNSFGAPKTKSSKASVKISPAVVAALRTQWKRVVPDDCQKGGREGRAEADAAQIRHD